MYSTDAWKAYEDAKIRRRYETRATDPSYPALVEEAAARGYEPAPLHRLLADDMGFDLYTWRGRTWIKSNRTPVPQGQEPTERGQLSLAL